MDEKRRHFKPEQKMEILREHLKNKVNKTHIKARLSV